MNNKLSIALILILVGLKFLVQPWFEWVELTSSEVSQKEKSYLKLSALDQKQEFALKEIERLQVELAPFDSRKLPASRAKSTTITLDYIKMLGERSDIKVVHQRLGEIQNGTLAYIPLEMFVEGNPVSLALFIKELETGPYIMVMAEANITSMTRKPNILTANLTMYVAIQEAK
ncbi:hypothetical protein ACU5DF_17865 [Aliivibrio wodanis]|uniref:hypothetical protein n=1 Tax=Aliivibrio wodanis TaxID=80852 RepID=UPI00406C0370